MTSAQELEPHSHRTGIESACAPAWLRASICSLTSRNNASFRTMRQSRSPIVGANAPTPTLSNPSTRRATTRCERPEPPPLSSVARTRAYARAPVPHPLLMIMVMGPGRGLISLSLSRARTYVSPFPHAGVSSLCCVFAGRSACEPVVEGSEFCVHHDRLLAEHGADALKQGLPRRKQARGRWQPTIIAVSADASEMSTEGSVSSDRRWADPSTVRPRLAEAAAENVDEKAAARHSSQTDDGIVLSNGRRCEKCPSKSPPIRRVSSSNISSRQYTSSPPTVSSAQPLRNSCCRSNAHACRLGSAP